MAEECPNCGKLTNTTQTRLVKDSCGHTKCRLCLLLEEYGCKSCDNEKQIQQIGNFDYPSREFSKPNNSKALTEELLHDNSNTTEHVKLLINNDTNNFEILPCQVPSSEDAEKTNFIVNTENDDSENDEWTISIDEENKNTQVSSHESNNKSDNEESEKEKPLKTQRKVVDRSHISILPGTPEKYKCEACGKIFQTKNGMSYHDFCVTGVRPFQCTMCEKSFIKRSHFEYHERIHTGNKPFKCTLCEKAFVQVNKLKRHMFSHSKTKPFICNNCGKSYRKKDDLKNHMTLHSEKATSYPCKLCGKSFKIASNLRRHIFTHSSERPFVCDRCNKGFKDRSLLKRHKLIHEKERPFACDDCSRYFLSKTELRRHITTHSSEKPFCCKFCKTYFRRKDNLNRHIRHHHSENNIPSENISLPSNAETPLSLGNKTVKQKPKKSKKSLAVVSNPKVLNKESVDYTNSLNQINSRLDSMGNITPVIRTTGELSNAVPVINGPISIKKFVESTETRKKTFTYIEPIPLAEAVVINQRIEEKLYQQNTSNNYFFRNYSTPSRSNISINSISHKSDHEKVSNQFERNSVKAKMKELPANNESDMRNLNLSQKTSTVFNERSSDSKIENEQSNYVSIIKKHVMHSDNQIESSSENKSLEAKDLQKTNSTYWRRRTAESLKKNLK